jgi:hypothetical protein
MLIQMKKHQSEQETAERLNAILKGAFGGPPTPLKAIPKKDGTARSLKSPRAGSSTAKTVRRGKKSQARTG